MKTCASFLKPKKFQTKSWGTATGKAVCLQRFKLIFNSQQLRQLDVTKYSTELHNLFFYYYFPSFLHLKSCQVMSIFIRNVRLPALATYFSQLTQDTREEFRKFTVVHNMSYEFSCWTLDFAMKLPPVHTQGDNNWAWPLMH